MFLRVMGLVCGLGVLAAGSAVAEESADSCLGFEKTEEEKSVVYAATNSCDQKLACELRWVVQCEDNDGKVTARAKKSARFTVSESGSHSISASAESCKQSWRIEDVAWHCNGAN
jgi:hypothetical protein